MSEQHHLTQQHLRRYPSKLARFTTVRIWSGEHSAWWRPNGCGYTTCLAEAGIYKTDDAWRRVIGCGPEKQIVLHSANGCPADDTANSAP